MAKMFPALEFSLSGIDDQGNFAFEGTIQGGNLELRDAPVIWTTIDPKTGEAISGSEAQVAPFVGKGLVFVRAGKANEIDGERPVMPALPSYLLRPRQDLVAWAIETHTRRPDGHTENPLRGAI